MRVALIGAFLLGGDAIDYDEARSIQYANFAGAAYCHAKSIEKWNCGSKCKAYVRNVTVCEGDTTKAFIANWEAKGLVSFEGTANLPSLLVDLQLRKSSTGWEQCDGCRVHTGFLKEYNSLRLCVMETLTNLGFGPNSGDNSVIRTTGHSLGAAVNNLAMIDLTKQGWHIDESYDFGKPRTGDAAFAQLHDRLFSGRTFRVTHNRDPVPELPLAKVEGYQHVEPEIYYPGKVSKGHQECFKADTACIEQFWNIPIDALHLPDHLDYMGVDTSIFGCPILDDEVAV